MAYIAAPAGIMKGGYLDTRLPVALVFIFLGSTSFHPVMFKRDHYLIMIILFYAIFRTAVLSLEWNKYDKITAEYINAYRMLPEKSILFVASTEKMPNLNERRAKWQPSTWHYGNYATLQKQIFVPATSAISTQQPITVSEKYQQIYLYHKHNPLVVKAKSDLRNIIRDVKLLLKNEHMEDTKSFMLILDPDDNIIENQTVISKGHRFAIIGI